MRTVTCLSEPLPWEAKNECSVCLADCVVRFMISGPLLRRCPFTGGVYTTRIMNTQCLLTEVHCHSKALANTGNHCFHTDYGILPTVKYNSITEYVIQVNAVTHTT